MQIIWKNLQELSDLPRRFRCSYCEREVASNKGYAANANFYRIYICPGCNCATFFLNGRQYPGVAFGSKVRNVPAEVGELYEEARRCISVSSYTASVLICRKILMNLAVDKGAKPNMVFVKYVEFLSENHYVPPDGQAWVDHIREKGNEATHEIQPMSRQDAELLVRFVEMLLRFVYEFPSLVPSAEASTT